MTNDLFIEVIITANAIEKYKLLKNI